MKISANVSKTDRKFLYIDNFEGVDYRGISSLSRGIMTSNLIKQNGKVVKRNGWKEKYCFNDKIDALSSIRLRGENYILVYSGKKFYLISGETITDITESGKAEYRTNKNKLIARPLLFFKRNDVYYIVGAGEYLSLGDFGEGIELRSVKKYAYIPTTTIGIMPKGKTVYVLDKSLDDSSRGIWYIKDANGYVSVVLSDENPWNPDLNYYNRVATYQMQSVKMEEQNVLTPFRKNTLYGVNSTATYKLDSENIARSSKTKVKIKVLESGEINEYTLSETASSNTLRGLEKGDNLKSKTIKVIANETPIYASGLQNGISQKGKVLLKCDGAECYWQGLGSGLLGWREAKLIFEHTDSENVLQKTVIAEAERNGLYGAYSITYKTLDINLSGTQDVIVEEILSSCSFKEYVKAMLPSYTYHLVDQNLLQWGSLNHKTGELSFIKSTTSPDGSDNIEVTFSVSDLEYNASAIDDCTLATEYGADGNTDRLFVSGNENLKNYDFASDSGDYTYFPNDYVFKFGLDGTPITGYQRLSDDSLAVFKDSIGDESNLYIRRGKYVNKSVEVGDNTYTFKKAEFTLSGCFLSNSSINGRLNKVFDGEPLFLTRSGVYTLKSNIDLMNERKSVVSRGVAVDGLIIPDLEKAKDAIVYKNDYYLQAGDRTYIAKSNSYFTWDNVRQYNWWIYENVPASVFAIIDGELWFGCEDGRICKFYDGYSDVFYDRIKSGNLLFEENNPLVSFSEHLKLKSKDKIIIEGNVFVELFENVTLKYGKIKVSETQRLGEIEVYVDNVGESGLETNTPYVIRNIDTDDNTFDLYKDGEKVNLASGGFRICMKISGKNLKIEELRFTLDVNALDTCTLSCFGKQVVPIKYNGNAIPLDVTAKIVRETPVVSVWKSALTDLHYPSAVKNIHTVGVDLGDNARGKVHILVSAKQSLNMYENSWDALDFLSPDFVNFTFSCKEERSIYANARLRGINRIGITVISDESASFEMKGISVEYSLLKQKRGVSY